MPAMAPLWRYESITLRLRCPLRPPHPTASHNLQEWMSSTRISENVWCIVFNRRDGLNAVVVLEAD